MTDVIGTGELDAPPRRRLRIPRWATLAAALVAVIAVIVVPAARTRLADGAAGWLQQQWSQRSAYDDARAAVIAHVNDRAGALDERVVEQAAAVADREEAAALSAMLHRVTAHRMWSGDADRARDAAAAALRFEVSALLHDADDGQPTTGYLFSSRLDKLVRVAGGRITSMARHRKLKRPRLVGVRLPPATAALDRLERPTDFRTGLSVVTASEDGAQVFDLDTGAVTELPRPGEFGMAFWSGGVVLSTRRGVRLLDAHGRVRAVLGNVQAELVSSDTETLWLRSLRGVRRFDVAGHPLTPWIRPPVTWTAVAGVGRLLVLGQFTDGPPQEQLWDPATGVRRPLPIVCDGGWTAAGHRLVAQPCDGNRTVTTLDVTTGRMRKFRLPAPVSGDALETTNPMSPSGDRFVVVLDGGNGLQAQLLDLRTGRLTPTRTDIGLQPVGWSVDGQWVLLAEQSSFTPGRRARVALWRPRDGRMTSVRLPVGVPLAQGTWLLSTTG